MARRDDIESGLLASAKAGVTLAERVKEQLRAASPGGGGEEGGGGSVAVGAAVVDFGATPVAEATFTVTAAGVSGSSVVQAWVIGNSTVDNDAQSHVQAGRSWRLTATPGNGSFSLDVMSLMGLCTGTFNIKYRY